MYFNMTVNRRNVYLHLMFTFFRDSINKTTFPNRSQRVSQSHKVDGWMDRLKDRSTVDSSSLCCPEWSESSLEFRNMHSRVVSMSPRLTFLMQDWEIQRSAPLKFLVGVRWEPASPLKTVCDIDIKTQHIEWCQMKFYTFFLWEAGKLGMPVWDE